jgi:hypothetical protein
MQYKMSLISFLCALTTIFMMQSCDTEDVRPAGSDDSPSSVFVRGGKGQGNGGDNGGGNGGGNGKGKNKDGSDGGDTDPVDPVEYAATYEITEYDDWGALWRFSISVDGDLMLFQTDSTVTHWGSDHWGSWADPFPYANGVVHYIKGLSNVTYEFVALPNDQFDVTKTVITGSYTGEITTTTVDHLGVYARLLE